MKSYLEISNLKVTRFYNRCYVNIIYVLFVKIEFKCFQYNADIAQKFI